MGRRKELQSVCNDLLDSFVSRYNDLDGYWALGKFQAYFQTTRTEMLVFSLTDETNDDTPFQQTCDYYRSAFHRHSDIRNIPASWVKSAVIEVETCSPAELTCNISVTTDKGKSYQARKPILARPHNPNLEFRRCGQHGPQNQKGQ